MNTAPPSFAAVLLALALGGCTDGPNSNLGDFNQFVIDRDHCDHMRGEMPDPDPDHPEDLKEAIAAINKACERTDSRLASLKAKYANDRAVMVKLDAYESNIESKRKKSQ